MLRQYETFLSPFEKILIQLQEKFPLAQAFKEFLCELTGEPNIPALAAKHGFEVHDLAIISRFSLQLAHYLLETELIEAKQKKDPVRMWSAA